MADYQIFTPPREPLEEELGEAMVEGMLWLILNCSAGDIQYQNRGIDQHLVVRLLYKDPAELYDYNFTDKTWRYLGGDAVDISTVDMTFPEDAVTSGTKMPYFNIFAFEKDTIACKLAAVEDAKLLIKNSIINKGVGVPDETKFREYAGLIEKITGNMTLAEQVKL